MNIKASHILGVLGIAGLGFYVYKKTSTNLKEIFQNLQALPTGLNNVKIENSMLKGSIDVTFFNNSNKSFNADGVVSFLKKINVLVGNKRVAEINIVKSKLNIPARGIVAVNDLKFQISIKQTLLNWKLLTGVVSINDFKIEPVFSILGEELIVSK